MKLVIWIAQANKETCKPAVRELLVRRLPRSIIHEACRAKGKDKKLVQIGDYLADLIHGQPNTTEEPEEQKAAPVESVVDKKAQQKQKMAAKIAAMKKR